MMLFNTFKICLKKPFILGSLVALSLFTIGFVLLGASPKPVSALSASSFTPGHIIDDAVFEDENAMSVQEIQNFLNAKVGTCDTYGTQTFVAPNGQKMTHAQWGSENGNPEPFTCINEYVENPTTLQNNFTNPTASISGGETAAQIIYNAGQQYGINPEVILTVLEKEQGLVTDNWPWYSEYQYAMGYSCPDSGSCSSGDADFYEQVNGAAWQFRQYLTNPGNYNYSTGYDYIQYNPTASCGGSVVDIQDESTAALYDYTPYQPDSATLSTRNATGSSSGPGPSISSSDACAAYGNYNFWWYFTSWFGSTTYFEPPDSLLISGNQSGYLYFVSLDNDTMYHIPTWSTLEAYGLQRYQIMPEDNADFDSYYTNGGTLKTLVFNNDDQKIYLVDNDTKYWFQSYCSQWGLDCLDKTSGDVTFLTSTYFDNYVNYGGIGQPIMEANGLYYLMQNGQADTFASLADMKALGYSTSQVISIVQTDLNAAQPLGPLQIAGPTFIQFPPNQQLMYFDNGNYYYVPTWDEYEAWGNQTVINPPTSSYNTTLPTTTANLSIWVTDGQGNDYLIDSGRKINITSDAFTWYSGTFQTLNTAALSSLPTSTDPTAINSAGSIYVIQNATKRHVPSYNDYIWLDITPSNTLNVDPLTASSIPSGPDILGDGGLFTVTGNSALYVTDNGTTNSSYYIPSYTIFTDFGFQWGLIDFNESPSVLSSGYPSRGSLTRWVRVAGGGSLSYVANDTLITVGSTAATNWGINTTTQPASTVDLALLYNLQSSKPLGKFVRDETTGGEYYASGGTYHYIASYSTFVSLGGLNDTNLNVYPDFFTGLTEGSTLN